MGCADDPEHCCKALGCWHHPHSDGHLVRLITRPAAGVFWARRISSSPTAGDIDEHGPKTKHRTLAAAKTAIEESAPSDP